MIVNHKTGSGFPMGTHRVSGEVQFTANLPFKQTFKLLIYNESCDVVDHVNMQDHKVSSGVCSVIVEGDIPKNWSYAYETELPLKLKT